MHLGPSTSNVICGISNLNHLSFFLFQKTRRERPDAAPGSIQTNHRGAYPQRGRHPKYTRSDVTRTTKTSHITACCPRSSRPKGHADIPAIENKHELTEHIQEENVVKAHVWSELNWVRFRFREEPCSLYLSESFQFYCYCNEMYLIE